MRTGSKGPAEPIRNRADIEKVRQVLVSARDKALFTLQINLALRSSDLLNLNVEDVQSLKPGDDLVVRERKTGKPRRLTFNQACYDAVQPLLGAPGALFVGEKRGTRLTVCTLSRLWKDWCRKAGLEGNYASHTGRKTFGYLARVERGVGLEVIQKALNHSSPAVTLAYICVQPRELVDLYSASL